MPFRCVMVLEAAHERQIVHRDIKPQNVMISKDGKVKVTDFGIAKAASSATVSTSAMGSVHYTSPEQARGGYADTKSDIYSVGITLYEMVTGHVPFDGETSGRSCCEASAGRDYAAIGRSAGYSVQSGTDYFKMYTEEFGETL